MAEAKHTPAAMWRTDGEPDPHGTRYDCERAALCMGNLTDDELANGVFMHGDGTHGRPPIEDIIAGRAHSPIAWLTAAKDRIRWLSRRLNDAARAFEIADESMYEMLLSEALGSGVDELEFYHRNGVDSSRIKTIAETYAHIREAFDWLKSRGYVELGKDEEGEFIRVLKRPGSPT